MTEVRLTAQEVAAVRTALSGLVVRARTGELGMMHGADRFLSTQRILKKDDRQALDAAARKLGVSIAEYRG